jgi:hypothetical protein
MNPHPHDPRPVDVPAAPASPDTSPPADQANTESHVPASAASLESVILLYEKALQDGNAPAPHEWLARYPHLRDELVPYFEDLAALEGVLPPGGRAPRVVALPEVPGYAIQSKLGEGGMGVVYLARDLSLPRLVALKMIRADVSLTAEQQARFRAEADSVARLKHPHIVEIHARGEHQGNLYLVLEFLRGGSLEGQIRDTPQPPPAAAHLVEVLARAVHSAHQVPIIHRDLKPGNVLLSPANPGDPGCTPYGLPKVGDFGLAKQLDLSQKLTLEKGVMGTASYMSPEQAAGQNERVGPATDVYALGVILYEMLTGRRPFQGDSFLSTLEQVRTLPPTPPRELRPDVPPELEAICLRCLAKQPAGRYPTAAALADDLHQYRTRVADPNAAPTVPQIHTEATQAVPVWRGRRWAVGAGLGVVLVAGLLWAPRSCIPPESHPGGGPAPTLVGPVAFEPLKGDIDVDVWDTKNPDRRGRLHAPGVLPVRVGDVVYIKVRVNRPAYLYVVWIDAAGKAAALYPWEDRDWAKRPQTEQKRSQLTLPEDPNFQGELPPGMTGMDALLLLVRETPLTAEDNQQLRVLFEGLGAQKAPRLQAAAWFENGEMQRDDPDRSAPVKQLRTDDPVMRTQTLLRTRLAGLFPYTRAVVFAFDGRER